MKEISFDFENVGGLQELYAVPFSNFRGVGMNYAKGTRYPRMSNRDEIIVIPMYADDTFQFIEEKDEADGGTFYKVSISGLIPKMEGVNEQLIEELERGQWVVLSRDNNGVIHLSGSADVPLTCTTNKDSGMAFAARNAITFEFSGNQSSPSVIIDAETLAEL